MNIRVINVSIIETVADDGDVRSWGACKHCAHVEELTMKARAAWIGYCETCIDDGHHDSAPSLQNEWKL